MADKLEEEQVEVVKSQKQIKDMAVSRFRSIRRWLKIKSHIKDIDVSYF